MKRFSVIIAVLGLVLALGAPQAAANHSWGGYHWARTSNPFTLQLGDNVNDAKWLSYLQQASTDWSTPSDPTVADVLDTLVVSGSTTPRRCRASLGRIEVCDYRYGFNQWLGRATIWLSGDHITKARVQLNDSYFDSGTYNDANAKQHVICQEIGHTFGLDHQRAVTSNSCMDDQDGLFDPAFAHPNTHDYEELALIYAHTDSTTTIAAPVASSQTVRVRVTGPTTAIVTYVTWA